MWNAIGDKDIDGKEILRYDLGHEIARIVARNMSQFTNKTYYVSQNIIGSFVVTSNKDSMYFPPVDIFKTTCGVTEHFQAKRIF